MLQVKNVMEKCRVNKCRVNMAALCLTNRTKKDGGVGSHFSWNSQELPLRGRSI